MVRILRTVDILTNRSTGSYFQIRVLYIWNWWIRWIIDEVGSRTSWVFLISTTSFVEAGGGDFCLSKEGRLGMIMMLQSLCLIFLVSKEYE